MVEVVTQKGSVCLTRLLQGVENYEQLPCEQSFEGGIKKVKNAPMVRSSLDKGVF